MSARLPNRLFPKAVVEDRDRQRAREFIRRHKVSPQNGRYPQKPEGVRADCGRRHVDRASNSVAEVDVPVGYESHPFKRMCLRTPVLKVRVGDATRAVRHVLLQINQPVVSLHEREAAKQHGVHDREDGDVQPDGERQHRDGG